VYEHVTGDQTPALTTWVLRVLWIVLAFAAGPAFADALDGASDAVRTVATAGLWSAWAAVVVATFVPRPIGLTTLRVVAPASVAALAAAAAGGHTSVPGLVVATIVVVLATTPEVASVFVNGGAYANERRFPLRVPGPLFLGPLELAWALVVVGVGAGPLLLAAEQWVAGAVASAVGLPLAWFLVRPLHTLSRRWAVLVPAGLVLHDPISLRDPVLFPRPVIEVLRPAAADTDSLDLSQRALGLTLELVLREKVPMTLMKPGARAGVEGASARLLFTPARPGALLTAAAERRIASAPC
jgi:hypothetical protein